MVIKSKLTEQDFINVNMVMLYKKTSIIIFTVLIFIFLFVTALTVAFLPEVSFAQLIVPLVMLVAFPIMT